MGAVTLIDRLRDHVIQDQFVYYHHWRVGDVVMWDETATMHRSAGDADPTLRRIMLGAALDHALGAANYRSLRADEALIAQVIFRTQWL
jgi:alpha-ketoglutarate-dependent taurine dioxygenase